MDNPAALISLALGIALLVGCIAHHKGRRWWAWGLLALFTLSPVVLMVILQMSKKTPEVKFIDAFNRG